jgi:hypothetical protein
VRHHVASAAGIDETGVGHVRSLALLASELLALVVGLVLRSRSKCEERSSDDDVVSLFLAMFPALVISYLFPASTITGTFAAASVSGALGAFVFTWWYGTRTTRRTHAIDERDNGHARWSASSSPWSLIANAPRAARSLRQFASATAWCRRARPRASSASPVATSPRSTIRMSGSAPRACTCRCRSSSSPPCSGRSGSSAPDEVGTPIDDVIADELPKRTGVVRLPGSVAATGAGVLTAATT